MDDLSFEIQIGIQEHTKSTYPRPTCGLNQQKRAKGPMTHGTFNARNYDTGILTHGILTQGGIWRRDTRGDFWRTEFWRIYIFNDFWCTEIWPTFLGGDFWRIYLRGDFWRIFGGWFLTHFSFVYGIWHTFWGVIFGGSIEALCFLGWLTQNTFCMHFDLVCYSVYVKFKVYATCFWTSFSCLGTAFPVFKHHFPVSERPFLL